MRKNILYIRRSRHELLLVHNKYPGYGSFNQILYRNSRFGNHFTLQPAPPSREGLTIGFEVASMDDTLALVALKGIPVTEGPHTTPKVKYFFVNDPDGVGVQFVEKL